MYKKVDIPTIITIMGVTGDLSTKKLLPALFDLYINGLLPTKFNILGFSRRELTNQDFSKFIINTINKKGHKHSQSKIKSFVKKCYYISGTFEKKGSYNDINNQIFKLENIFGQCTNKLYYLAVPPVFYTGILKNLKSSGLSKPCSKKSGWARILIEKPFGHDMKSAKSLDSLLSKLFREEQIYRIDHYLEKEMVENILAFRFSNSIFEPLWSHKYIEKVEIRLYEKDGIRNRGLFYDNNGALRDVGQNHVLQMLALVAMEQPTMFDAKSIRKNRVNVFKALEPFNASSLKLNVIRGQYDGYRLEKNIPKTSQTETYFKIKTFLKSKRWKNVPFILESGKQLSENKTEIKIYFKPLSKCFCPVSMKVAPQNILKFTIQPNPSISLYFWSLESGIKYKLHKQELSFEHKASSMMKFIPDAYEKVLFDCIFGDQSLFPSGQEELASWVFITSILKRWNKIPLRFYKKGSKNINNK